MTDATMRQPAEADDLTAGDAGRLTHDGGDMELARQMRDYRLTTAEILYHLPDHPAVLQTFIWQELDLAPRYPVLRHFLDFWDRELEGKLHSVRVASASLITPGRMRHPKAWLNLH